MAGSGDFEVMENGTLAASGNIRVLEEPVHKFPVSSYPGNFQFRGFPKTFFHKRSAMFRLFPKISDNIFFWISVFSEKYKISLILFNLPQTNEDQVAHAQPDYVTLSRDDVYKELRLRGYDYGPTFQGIIGADNFGTSKILAVILISYFFNPFE